MNFPTTLCAFDFPYEYSVFLCVSLVSLFSSQGGFLVPCLSLLLRTLSLTNGADDDPHIFFTIAANGGMRPGNVDVLGEEDAVCGSPRAGCAELEQ